MRFRDFLASILEQDLGCSCHEYVNQNGYGQCKKKDFHQEHVKLLHVCYVNQPSNCSDLYSSVTDPGKKLSAEACPIGRVSKFYLRYKTINTNIQL